MQRQMEAHAFSECAQEAARNLDTALDLNVDQITPSTGARLKSQQFYEKMPASRYPLRRQFIYKLRHCLLLCVFYISVYYYLFYVHFVCASRYPLRRQPNVVTYCDYIAISWRLSGERDSKRFRMSCYDFSLTQVLRPG